MKKLKGILGILAVISFMSFFSSSVVAYDSGYCSSEFIHSVDLTVPSCSTIMTYSQALTCLSDFNSGYTENFHIATQSELECLYDSAWDWSGFRGFWTGSSTLIDGYTDARVQCNGSSTPYCVENYTPSSVDAQDRVRVFVRSASSPCPYDDTIDDDDVLCVACSYTNDMIESDSNCVPCSLDDSIGNDDPLCEACSSDSTILKDDVNCTPCQYDISIDTDDPLCYASVTFDSSVADDLDDINRHMLDIKIFAYGLSVAIVGGSMLYILNKVFNIFIGKTFI